MSSDGRGSARRGGSTNESSGLIDEISLSDLGIGWVSALRPVAEQGPVEFVRSVITSTIVRPTVKSILGIFGTLISGVLLVLRGSKPGFSPDEEVLGVADLVPFLVSLVADLATWLVTTYFDVVVSVVEAVVPEGPFGAAAAQVLVAVITVVSVILLVRATLAIIDAIPILGGLTEFV